MLKILFVLTHNLLLRDTKMEVHTEQKQFFRKLLVECFVHTFYLAACNADVRYSDENSVRVRPSVCLSVYHTRAL